jgi:hypothetical protein
MNLALPSAFSLISKIATAPPVVLDDTHAPQVILGFVSGLQKEGGLSEREAWGFVRACAEAGGMPKRANPEWFNKLYNKASAGIQRFSGTDGAVAVKNIQGAMDQGTAKLKETAGQVMKDAPGQLWQGVKDTAGKAWDEGKAWMQNPENLQRIAPYAIGGIGTMLGAKMLGADNSTAMLGGLAGGALGGYGYNHWDEIKNKANELLRPPEQQGPPASPPTAPPTTESLAEANHHTAEQISQSQVLGHTGPNLAMEEPGQRKQQGLGLQVTKPNPVFMNPVTAH